MCKNGLEKTKSARTDNPETLVTLGTQDIERIQDEFEDTKGAIRIRISHKNRQHNGQKKNYKRTTNDQQTKRIQKFLISPNPLTLIHIILLKNKINLKLIF